jgi:hypothetical protein
MSVAAQAWCSKISPNVGTLGDLHERVVARIVVPVADGFLRTSIAQQSRGNLSLSCDNLDTSNILHRSGYMGSCWTRENQTASRSSIAGVGSRLSALCQQLDCTVPCRTLRSRGLPAFRAEVGRCGGGQHDVLFAGVTGMACKRPGVQIPSAPPFPVRRSCSSAGVTPEQRVRCWSDPRGSRVSKSLRCWSSGEFVAPDAVRPCVVPAQPTWVLSFTAPTAFLAFGRERFETNPPDPASLLTAGVVHRTPRAQWRSQRRQRARAPRPAPGR